MDWNVAHTYQKANHNPVVVLNGNEGKAWASAKIKDGEEVVLTSKGSQDPDGDLIQMKWWVYREAGNYTGDFEIFNPSGEEIKFPMPKWEPGQSLHVFLEVRDSGTPALTTYRRMVLWNQ